MVSVAALGHARGDELPHRQPCSMKSVPVDESDANLITNLDVIERLELLQHLELFDSGEDQRETPYAFTHNGFRQPRTLVDGWS